MGASGGSAAISGVGPTAGAEVAGAGTAAVDGAGAVPGVPAVEFEKPAMPAVAEAGVGAAALPAGEGADAEGVCAAGASAGTGTVLAVPGAGTATAGAGAGAGTPGHTPSTFKKPQPKPDRMSTHDLNLNIPHQQTTSQRPRQ